jgi:hypothetical protein
MDGRTSFKKLGIIRGLIRKIKNPTASIEHH